MALKLQYDTQDAIPEAFRPLYEEKEGKYAFKTSEVEGMKTQADIDRMSVGLTKERNDHKESKTKLSKWVALGKSPEEIQEALDRLPELEAAAEAGGSKSADAVKKQVEAGMATATAKHQRELQAAKDQFVSLGQRVEAYEERERRQAIKDAAVQAVSAFKGGKFNDMEDVLLYAERHLEVEVEKDDKGNQLVKRVKTKDGVGVTPDVDPAVWLTEMVGRKAHWLVPSEGGGSNPRGNSGGGGGVNPWSAKGWNVTHQAAYYREHGEERARQMAASAGSELGATHAPAPRK